MCLRENSPANINILPGDAPLRQCSSASGVTPLRVAISSDHQSRYIDTSILKSLLRETLWTTLPQPPEL